jgi:hypothetical protein
MSPKIYTTVGITPELKQQLDDLKLCKCESYEHLIRRVLGGLHG